MPGRLAALTLVLAAVVACSESGTPAASPRPSPAVPVSPPPALRAPADAVLADAGGPALITVRDHLTAAEYAASAPDQVIGLDQVSGWGWEEASLRQWSGGGRSAQALVLRTDRASGARLAFAAWSEQASATPFVAGDCPASVSGLDECRLGAAGARSILVGRLDAETFRLDLNGLDAAALGAAQAQRLRAPLAT